ncbi:hypothetical protein KUV51_08795 [Tateyamaria omphalii]|uniref:hypothetical protein n=1 Tax=Tateyamaria omphalii TaxID=299262 RepID=UPI001C997816|nr:hypothetical protein [Tateyamaria omphalii]MBY5933092.1 hypothetical protein [Tateyamaria omphalii]
MSIRPAEQGAAETWLPFAVSVRSKGYPSNGSGADFAAFGDIRIKVCFLDTHIPTGQ